MDIRNSDCMGLFVFLLEDLIMVKKPTYEELERRVKRLERRVEDRTRDLRTTLTTMKRKEKEIIQNKSSFEKVYRQLMETSQALSVLARNIDRDKETLEKEIFMTISSKIMPIIIELQMDIYCKKREADLKVLAMV